MLRENMSKYDAIVIGSGLSGMSTAIRLLDNEWKVLVLEKRKVIGGRTSSWNEKGMEVESGFHRFLGFYEHLPNLIQKVGVKIDDIIFWEDETEIKLPKGEPSAVFALAPLFKPVKTVQKLFTNNDFISPPQKIALTKFFASGFYELKTNPDNLDKKTVATLAKESGIDNTTLTRVLVPLTEGLFFLKPERYSAYNFFSLFSPYLTKLHKSRSGAYKGGMSKAMMEPMQEFINNIGGKVSLNSKVTNIIIENGVAGGVALSNGDKIPSKRVVIATSLYDAQQLLKNSLHDTSEFADMLRLPTMPSVTFQIELKEPSMPIDRTTFSPGTIFSSYSEQSRTTFPNSKGRISIILSDPDKNIDAKPDALSKLILEDAKKLELNIDEDSIIDYRKVSWKMDFYSYEKGVHHLRPSQTTAIKGLYLAGDYTKQEYLSTMEGAVRSGELAAEAVMEN